MYHGVPARNSFAGVANFWGYNVPVREFEQQVRYLERCCNVIGLRDLLAGTKVVRGRMNVVITFDDGYENNCTNAFPVLRDHGMPAVYALATSFVRDKKPLWNDLVEFMVNATQREHVSITWGKGDQEDVLEVALDAADGRLNMYHWLMYKCVTIDQEQRDEFLAAVAEDLSVSTDTGALYENEDNRPLTAAQVSEMARSELVEFASHSVQHLLLGNTNREQKRHELVQSKREIEAMTGKPCTLFCVPGGSYDPELLEEAFSAGYECVLTSDVGRARPGDRVLNRNGVFRREMPWFSDLVHGPVGDMVRGARKMKGKLAPSRGGDSR